MTALHVYFTLRQQQAFHRLLDTPTRSQSSSHGQPGSSGGKSWTRPSPLSSLPPSVSLDVNARDRLGRTVLHLAAAATDAAAPEYVRRLLAHPHINVNAVDGESHWTALHRALYHGNLATALLLLQRPDIDVALKDSEGYTAFDLYNSTVEGTNPRGARGAGDKKVAAELLTWGANRNAALGHGDADDRAFPDVVSLEPAVPRSVDAHVEERFASVLVKQVVMSKLHTGVVTTEPKANYRSCGFGSGGRLGPGQHTQYNLVQMAQLPQAIDSVALGQDHTLALTTSGEVLSWGLNRFAQLGYVLDPPVGAGMRSEEPIQPVPRKIGASLSRKVVIGVAACRMASACWTSSEVYTWGTNNGQLGYDKNAHPVQVLPRVVTKVAQPVLSVTITDSALACLLESHDVLCLYNDSHFRVTFPAHAFPSEIRIYRPPQAVRNTSIDKITACDNLFAALSSNGELFTFSLPLPGTEAALGGGGSTQGKNRELVKPQRVWALRKKFSAVKDVALGADGSIIICTEAGHVFVRTRSAGKAFKFQRVSNLQRVVRVCANSTGAFGALRVDAELDRFEVVGNLLPQDMAQIQPYFPLVRTGRKDKSDDPTALEHPPGDDVELEDPEDIVPLSKDKEGLTTLCRVLLDFKAARDAKIDDVPFGSLDGHLRCGADLLIHVQTGTQPKIPAHRLLLAARSSVLCDILAGRRTLEYRHENVAIKMSLADRPSRASTSSGPHRAPWKDPVEVRLKGCHPLTVLILLVYLYTDELLSIWDWRVAETLKTYMNPLGINVSRLKMELQACAHAFQLPILASTLEAAFKRDVPTSLVSHILPLCSERHGASLLRDAGDPLATDVVLLLQGREVPCHSAVLRARSPLFQSLFDNDVWTVNRWAADGTIKLDFRHMKWDAFKFVIRYFYGGDKEMFDILTDVNSTDELIDLMVDVIAVANELLLDRLSLICSVVILRRVTIANAASVFVDSIHFNATSLARSVQGYIARALETFLESHMLEDLPIDIVKQLSAFIRAKHAEKAPLSRSSRLVDTAMEKNADWLAEQDIPQPLIVRERPLIPKDAKLSPPGPIRREKVSTSPSSSPMIRPQISSTRLNAVASNLTDGEMFIMDGIESVPRLSISQSQAEVASRGPKEQTTPGKAAAGWKVPSAPRADMKTIMAEAEVSRPSGSKATALRPGLVPTESSNWRSPPPPTTSSASHGPPGSPWKSLTALTNTNTPSNLSPVPTPPATPLLRPSRPEVDRSSTVAGPSRQGPQATIPQRPGMGPVISPPRQTSRKNAPVAGIRRASSNQSPWTLPPVQPVVQSSPSTTATTGMSFVAIQQLQLEQDTTPKKDKRSLVEIQEEEQARRAEEDFMKWWAAEEERMKMEQEAESAKASKHVHRSRPKKDTTRARESRQGGEGSEAGKKKQERKDGSSATKREKKRPAQQAPQEGSSKAQT
ncbi:hypothetical protein BDW22DRAFT_1486805 [Trametopsis cervina]|nr:hypothetical protein BDW22DRAFT_1486805 [Trametopsis cervina]